MAGLGTGLACATPLSASHTATVVKPGHVEVAVATGQNFPVGAELRLTPKLKNAEKTFVTNLEKKHQITIDPTQDTYIAVGAALSLAGLPQEQWEVGIRVGILPRLDLGLRFTGSTWRGELFGQMYDGAVWKVAAGVGGAYRTFNESYAGVLQNTGLLAFSEIDADGAVLAGPNWKYGALYFGPKVVWSRYLVGACCPRAPWTSLASRSTRRIRWPST